MEGGRRVGEGEEDRVRCQSERVGVVTTLHDRASKSLYLHLLPSRKERILLSGVDSDSLTSLVHALTFNDDLAGIRVYMGNFLIKPLEMGLIGRQCRSCPLPSRRRYFVISS